MSQEEFKVGDHVAYSVQFLKIIGVYSGYIANGKGIIKEFKKIGEHTVLASIEWINTSEELPRSVNVKNLAKVGANSKYCAC